MGLFGSRKHGKMIYGIYVHHSRLTITSNFGKKLSKKQLTKAVFKEILVKSNFTLFHE